MPRKPTMRGKNSSRNIPKAFRSGGFANHAILCTDKTFVKDVKNYMKTEAYKKSNGHVIKEGEAE